MPLDQFNVQKPESARYLNIVSSISDSQGGINYCGDKGLCKGRAYPNSTSSWPCFTVSPAETCTALMVPAVGAAMFVSIFIASITMRTWFSSTASPGETATERIVPAIGL